MSETENVPSLLLVDDDETFCRVLGAALQRRGFAVTVAHNVADGARLAEQSTPEYAVVDLKMPGESGLVLVEKLYALDPSMRIVVLTGYASVATAVAAVKLGATQYLPKPVNADEIVAALSGSSALTSAQSSSAPLSPGRLEWEHIQRVLQESDGNISVTARKLGMHRRTLQRKLAKRPVPR
jgi:two-component system response regulator RegA